jgi:flagellar protein FliO/FliZ
MSREQKRKLIAIGILFFLLTAVSVGWAAPDAASSGGYLSGYENTDPRPSQLSWWSTLAYLLSLLAVFAFVAVMAYFASKFLSGRFAQSSSGAGGRILEHLPLGPNRSVCVVELADRVFMLGVTEHSITLLREITDPEEIERLHRQMLGKLPADSVFSQQLRSIEQLTKRIPSLFNDGTYRK